MGLVVAFKTAPMLANAVKTLPPLLEKHRGVRAVSVDTTVWKVKLEDKLVRSRPARKGGDEASAELLCLARKGASVSGARGGSFFHPAEGGEPWDVEALEEFLRRCSSGKSLVETAKSPALLPRPAEAAHASTK